VNQKFPNRNDDKNGESDAVANDTGFTDFFLFHHAILPCYASAWVILLCYALSGAAA
jgi:hypothetical protein